jgi:hypothetical protein
VTQDFWSVKKKSYIAAFGLSVSGSENGNFEFLFCEPCGGHEFICPHICGLNYKNVTRLLLASICIYFNFSS